MRGSPRHAAVAGLAVLALVAAACGSTKSNNSSSPGGTSSSGGSNAVKTDVGVTDSKISLGELTDLHGTFAALGKSITNAEKLAYDQINSAGGICNRQVELTVKDHGYDVQQAVTLYQQISNQVLGLPQSLGSPMNTALLPNYQQDNMLAIPASWAETLLANPNIMMVGTSYPVEMIDGIDWMVEKGKLKSGDKIGHIYFEGEYGENGLIGSKFAAEKNGLTLIPVKIKATDSDISAQVTNLKSQGAKAILLTTGPKQTASAAATEQSIGYDVPILGNNPVWAPGIMDTAAKSQLEKNLYIEQSWAAPSASLPAVQKVVSDYQKAYPGAEVDQGVTWGYAAANAFAAVLKKACDNGDLTRAGVADAFRASTSIDTNGIVAPLDYSKKGSPPSMKIFVFQPKNDVPGKIAPVQADLYEGKDVAGYTPAPLKSS